MIRRVLTALTALLSLAALGCVIAPDAFALLTPQMSVLVSPLLNGTGFKACAHGQISAPLVAVAHWEFQVVGARDSVSNPTIFSSVPGDGTSFNPQCAIVNKLGADAGEFTASVVMTSASLDLSRAVVGHALWNPLIGDEVGSMTTCDTGCAVVSISPPWPSAAPGMP